MPQLNSPLQHKLKMIASAPNVDDFLDLLEGLRNHVTDVRTSIGENDTVEMRKALDKYLSLQIDQIKRIIKSNREPLGESGEEDLN